MLAQITGNDSRKLVFGQSFLEAWLSQANTCPSWREILFSSKGEEDDEDDEDEDDFIGNLGLEESQR